MSTEIAKEVGLTYTPTVGGIWIWRDGDRFFVGTQDYDYHRCTYDPIWECEGHEVDREAYESLLRYRSGPDSFPESRRKDEEDKRDTETQTNTNEQRFL